MFLLLQDFQQGLKFPVNSENIFSYKKSFRIFLVITELTPRKKQQLNGLNSLSYLNVYLLPRQLFSVSISQELVNVRSSIVPSVLISLPQTVLNINGQLQSVPPTEAEDVKSNTENTQP